VNSSPPKGLLTLIAFFAVCLSLSCGSAPTPTANSNTNVATQTAASNADPAANKPAAAAIDPACDDSVPIATRRTNVETNLKELVAADKELGTKVEVTVAIAGDPGKEFLEVYVSSKDSGPTAIGGEDELEDLSKIVRKFFKSKCVKRVFFVAPGSGTITTRTRAIEWTACEHPEILCSDGICKRQC
jgi:hypothetical protein